MLALAKAGLNKHSEKEALAPYSAKVHVDHGSMVLWSEMGRLHHQALPTELNNQALRADTLLRLVRVHMFGVHSDEGER